MRRRKVASARYQNRSWNRMGPHVPVWFQRRLRRIDPHLVLQFTPPRCPEKDQWRGVPANIYPHGVWDVCYKLPLTGALHPVAVWSLADSNGNFALPGCDTLKLLRTAVYLHRKRQGRKLEAMMDRAMKHAQSLKASDSTARVHNAYQRLYSLQGRRQWNNRVYMRREAPHEATA